MQGMKILRFLYINIYSFLIICTGILVLILPFYRITLWILLVQGLIAIYLFNISLKLFSTYNDKLIKIKILLGKNKNKFRPETFKVFMQAPCSRLMVRYVLKIMNKRDEYKNLLKFKKTFVENMREGCIQTDTVIYFNEEKT